MTTGNGTGRFLGIAVSKYDDERWQQLTAAPEAVKALERMLAEHGYETQLLDNPDTETLLKQLEEAEDLKNGGFKGPFVLVWSGHGEIVGKALSLILRDTPATEAGKLNRGYQPGKLAAFLSESGSRDSLVIIDSCHSGAANADLYLQYFEETEASAWVGRSPRFACVVSCKSYEQVEDGAFLKALIGVLEEGPGDVTVLQKSLLWGSGSREVSLTSLIYVLEHKVAGGATHPRIVANGISDISFPNPRYDPDAPAGLVDDRIREVYGKPPRPSLLVETPAARQLIERVDGGDPGLWLLTGGPGKGKSCCLVVAADGSARRLLLLQASSGVEHLAAAVAAAPPEAAVAIDALDRAAPHEQAAIIDLATGWSNSRFVVVAVKQPPPPDSTAQDAGGPLTERADFAIYLDNTDWEASAIGEYVRRRLQGDSDDEA